MTEKNPKCKNAVSAHLAVDCHLLYGCCEAHQNLIFSLSFLYLLFLAKSCIFPLFSSDIFLVSLKIKALKWQICPCFLPKSRYFSMFLPSPAKTISKNNTTNTRPVTRESKTTPRRWKEKTQRKTKHSYNAGLRPATQFLPRSARFLWRCLLTSCWGLRPLSGGLRPLTPNTCLAPLVYYSVKDYPRQNWCVPSPSPCIFFGISPPTKKVKVMHTTTRSPQRRSVLVCVTFSDFAL